MALLPHAVPVHSNSNSTRAASDEVAEFVREGGAPPSSLDGAIFGLGLAPVAVPLEEGRGAVRGRGHAVGGGHEGARVVVKVGIARKLRRGVKVGVGVGLGVGSVVRIGARVGVEVGARVGVRVGARIRGKG